jgi:Flp pilus assembly pilin Flp
LAHAAWKPILGAENAAGAARPSFTQEVTSVLQLKQIRREEGQTMAEYGVVLTVITVMALSALTLLSTNVASALMRVGALVGVGNG